MMVSEFQELYVLYLSFFIRCWIGFIFIHTFLIMIVYFFAGLKTLRGSIMWKTRILVPATFRFLINGRFLWLSLNFRTRSVWEFTT